MANYAKYDKVDGGPQISSYELNSPVSPPHSNYAPVSHDTYDYSNEYNKSAPYPYAPPQEQYYPTAPTPQPQQFSQPQSIPASAPFQNNYAVPPPRPWFRKKRFWAVFIVVWLVLIIAVGAGVGVAVHNKHKADNTDSSDGSDSCYSGGILCESSEDCYVDGLSYSSCLPGCDGYSYCS